MTDMQDDPPSPCVGICQINPVTQVCDGCFRSEDEVASWWDLDPDGKRTLLAKLDVRREKLFDDLFD
jgi:predicted Fe-S protein YdhL (DUF1289 family)